MKNNILYYLTILLCVYPFQKHFAATGWNNFILNFDKGTYGRGSQTWQIAPYDSKWIYFANKNGILQFDGNAWDVLPLNNRMDVRSVSVSADRKRIYAGGINEFGYFQPNEEGTLTYHCLSDSLETTKRLIGNVWGIHESENTLYVQGDECVLKCRDGENTLIGIDAKIDCSNIVNNVLYIGTDKGIWFLTGNSFFPLQGAERLAQKRIRSILPYKEGILVVTAYDGLYYCHDQLMENFTTGAEEFMKRNEVFCAAEHNGQLALGTIHKGILLIDTSTMQLKYFDEHNGLHNNTVLSVAFDINGNLWSGLDSGIDHVYLSSPFTNLYSYPYSYGAGYTAAVKDGILYLGTNRGLYYVPYPVKFGEEQPEIKAVPSSSGQVWGLNHIGNKLFCMHDRGIFLIEGTFMKRIPGIIGAWCCQPVSGHPDQLYVGAYNGIYLLVNKEGTWQVSHKIEGYTSSSRIFEQETDRIIWVYQTDHVTRLELDDQHTKMLNQREYGVTEGFPTDRNMVVSRLKDSICFATPEGIYRYNADKDRMEPWVSMNHALNGETAYTRLLSGKNHLVCLKPYELCFSNLDIYKQGVGLSIFPIRKSLIELVPDFEAIIPVTDSLMIIPNENGFALFSLPHSNKHHEISQELCIKKMYLTSGKDSLIYTANYLRQKNFPVIDYKLNSVRFDYNLSAFEKNDIRFRYRLNEEPWSENTISRTKEYSNLPEGEYTFEVKAIFPDGRESYDSIKFKVLPPWYRTLLAYICYSLLSVFILWSIYRWDEMRLKRKKQQAVKEKDKRMQEMEEEYEQEKERQEKQIMQLEKEKLEYDLQHKSQEMANLMINFLRKNEMLTEIKSEIMKVASKLTGEGASEGKKQLILINNKIDSNIQSDEVLKRIEDQFDLIHNNFMKRLHEKHPDLSNNERMMCAYLKMNLSTKEIAPLLNISVRGVETIRYRLRKKFHLEREESLTDYLSNKL